MMRIVTVAAGGGSICRLDGHRLVVGPESAGATPGPVCYGHAEAAEPTITDANLVLGRLLPDRFAFPLDRERAEGALAVLASRLGDKSREELAEGFFHIANTNMAEAIRQISVARGYDTRDHALVVFGGAGGQHACALAKRLGMTTVLFHPLAGVLSAWGIGLAPESWHGDVDAGRRTLSDDDLAALAPALSELAARGKAALGRPDARVVQRVDLRYRGTESSITLELAGAAALRAAFDREHAKFQVRRAEVGDVGFDRRNACAGQITDPLIFILRADRLGARGGQLQVLIARAGWSARGDVGRA